MFIFELDLFFRSRAHPRVKLDMKTLLLKTAGFYFLLLNTLMGLIQPGDSYEKMREELGEPTAQIKRVDQIAYSFPQGVVYVENGRVVKLSAGFYKKVDQISRQTAEGIYEIQVGDGLHRGPESETGFETAGTDFETKPSGPAVWLESYTLAKQKSGEVGYPILMLFTSREDCAGCKEFDEMILPDPVFQQFIDEGLVLLRLEYPGTLEAAREAEGEMGDIVRSFGIQEFPMLLVLDVDGKELGRTGYQYLPPEAFVIYLQETLFDGGVSAEEAANSILRDEFGDAVDRLMFLDGISGSSLMLSAQIFVGCILAFLLVRRLMRK